MVGRSGGSMSGASRGAGWTLRADRRCGRTHSEA
jgi:hypothetical protein